MSAGFGHESPAIASVEWYTPPWVFERLGVAFDLDPCSPPGGLPWGPAPRYYSISDDGLSLPWFGSVWLNPPYGRQTAKWLAKMAVHRDGVALVFSRTDCSWFHDHVAKADAIAFLRGRIRFVDGNGVTGNAGPGCGSLLAAWGAKHVEALGRMDALVVRP